MKIILEAGGLQRQKQNIHTIHLFLLVLTSFILLFQGFYLYTHFFFHVHCQKITHVERQIYEF